MATGCARSGSGAELHRHARMPGNALLEWLVAVPVVLVIGLAVLQWSLIWQARHALEYAALRAAQVAATAHGEADSVRAGLVDGLGPLWGVSDFQQNLDRLNDGEQSGWLAWHRVWPPPAVFADFGEPAHDQYGKVLPNLVEVPNDNLRFRVQAPGAASGLTLHEANQLSIRVRYGAPLIVPLISTLMVRVMEVVDGCASAERLQLVATDMQKASPDGGGRDWACKMYRAPRRQGGARVWRLPLQVAASARMHSPLRAAGISGASSRRPLIPGDQSSGPDQPWTAPVRNRSPEYVPRPDFSDWVDDISPDPSRNGPASGPDGPGDGHCDEV